jgi:hypothetical protein
MHDHRIEIISGGRIDPPTLEGVNANDAVTIANRSGTGVTVTYPAGANPFSDVEGDTSETLPDGGETKHTIFADFNPSATYNLVVALEDDPRETSPRIRITGGGGR